MAIKQLEGSYLDLGGTIRHNPANLTLERLQPLLSAFGITRIANITGLDQLEIPVAICIRPNSKHLAVSQGKGLTWELAQVSAIMESIEGYHAENVPPPEVIGSYKKLKQNYPIVNPMLFNPASFTIPNIEEWEMGWTKALDINQQQILIPHALICLNSTVYHPEYNFLSVSSNGLAAGNTKEEAICHAIYEIIERDALWRWGQLPNNKIDESQLLLSSIDSEINQAILEKLYKGEQSVKVWDITSPIGIPSFHCVIKDRIPIRNLGMFRGTGTHLSKEIALSRALTEAAQSRAAIISGTRDDIFTDQYQRNQLYPYSKDLYLEGKKKFQNCYQPSFELGFAKNIEYLYARLKEQNYPHIYIVDHTKERFKIPVVHVFIPKMQYSGTRI